MKKIVVNKSDEAAVIVEKIIETPEKEVVLSIPRFSHLGESLSNFHLLKREADAIEKEIIIESVDDHVVELAEMSGLKALNPFFSKNKRQFSDIVAPTAVKASKSRRKQVAEDFFVAEKADKLEKSLEDDFMKLGVQYEGPAPKKKFRITFLKTSFPRFGKRFFVWIFLLVIFILGGYACFKILPKATVKIIVKTQEWSYNDSIITDKSASLNVSTMTIPNQILAKNENIQKKYPANGKRRVEKKAAGIITVYNAYSSDPQPLIEQTRFISPDGKIFRLAKSITVPGAKIIETKIVPSSIDAAVVADGAGPDFNIGPVKLFTIPGFKGNPKYQGFYGESKNSMAGGFVGDITYPTADDIKKAKTDTQTALEIDLKAKLFSQVPKDFKVLDGASKFKIVSQKIDEEADKDGQFGIFTEARMAVIAFKEEDLKDLFADRIKNEEGADFDIRSFSLEYGLARADFDRGILTFPVNFKAVLARHIDAANLKNRLLGKSEPDFKAAIFTLPGLDSATVSLWPFWVKNVPNSIEKIEIMVE